MRGVVLPEGSRPVFPSELADALEEHLGYPLDRKRWSAELRALAHDGVTPAQICAAYDWLNYDSYWDGRTFNLALIRRELPVMRARGFRRPGAPPPGGEPFAYSLAEREAWEAAGFRPRSALEAREWRDEHGWPQDGGRTDEEVHKWRREKGFV